MFTLPAEVTDIAFQNKAAVYGLRFRAASETMTTIAADPKHLDARIDIIAVPHTWGSAMTHHPHIHMIVPGGGLSPEGSRWVSSRPAFLLPVRVLGKLFRRLVLTRLMVLYEMGRLAFYGSLAHLSDRRMSATCRRSGRSARPLAKSPFAGPQAVHSYLSRYTHRVVISNRRLSRFDETGVTIRYKDSRRRRVHPPLPAPRPPSAAIPTMLCVVGTLGCSAQELPPHPPPLRVRLGIAPH